MNQDPEMPSVTPPVEGTDFDETLRLAQEEKKKADDAIRMNDAFGVVPGRLPSDEQFTAMQDFQGAIDGHEARVAENAAALEGLTLENYMQKVLPTGEALRESDKPLDAIQQEQAKEEGDLDYLTNLFGESSSKDHLDAAWKLFDEFVDKKGLSREAERQLRDHFMNINHGVVATAEAPAEPTPETPVPGDEPSPEGSPDMPQDGAEATHAEGAFDVPKATEGEAIPVETADAEKPEESADEVKPEAESETQESGEPTPEHGSEDKPEGSEDELKPEGEGEEGKSEEGPVLFNYEDYETFEDKPKDEEKEKISIFARMKAGGEKFHERFDHFFNGGTEEQNSKRKMVCVGLAVGAVGIMVAVGTGFAVHNADMANFAAQSTGRLNEVAANFHGVAAAGVGAAQEAIRHTGEQLSAVQQHLAGSGDTIWAHAHGLLEQWGAKPTNANILRLTSGIIKDNGLNWESARHMANGAKFVVNIPSWIK
jgi:hypothetical protein